MKRKKLGVILMLSVGLLASCDYAYDYTYEVTNDTYSEIKIKVKTFRIDSTYSVLANETQVLFVDDHGVEGSKGPYFDDVTVDLDDFKVTKNDTLISIRDYLKNDAWTFNNGVYSTTVTNDEFK